MRHFLPVVQAQTAYKPEVENAKVAVMGIVGQALLETASTCELTGYPSVARLSENFGRTLTLEELFQGEEGCTCFSFVDDRENVCSTRAKVPEPLQKYHTEFWAGKRVTMGDNKLRILYSDGTEAFLDEEK